MLQYPTGPLSCTVEANYSSQAVSQSPSHYAMQEQDKELLASIQDTNNTVTSYRLLWCCNLLDW